MKAKEKHDDGTKELRLKLLFFFFFFFFLWLRLSISVRLLLKEIAHSVSDLFIVVLFYAKLFMF